MRGQIKREVTQEEFEKLIANTPDLHKNENGVYTRVENLSKWTVWNRPVAAKIGEKFYVMRPA